MKGRQMPAGPHKATRPAEELTNPLNIQETLARHWALHHQQGFCSSKRGHGPSHAEGKVRMQG